MEIDESLVLLDAHADDAEHAITLAGQLLVQAGRATADYLDAMVRAYHELGPYIVLAPHIAMPHARPENGALREGIAVVRLVEPVPFGHPHNDPVSVVIPLVGVDANAHIAVLRRLSAVLMDDAAVTTILQADDPKTVVKLFNPLQEG
ncbi:PTS sugar transporter subunit IIA [Georgenia sp. TF02-10]|uniref:PTS sugar transporter subunit IIA n=1 Tax=Georgenia sp. TF02-10 TaxID=2917725 RepID=UPI001FA7F314|nr:PTS sugar transporter subunit IIA [Georgenia sp. TF02-10]UNX54617.1 PTS sugar transporter subunit IIA [Georgenia sp. TF02-10]